MNLENNEIDPQVPAPAQESENNPKGTLEWVIFVLARVGAGYAAKVILKALGL